MQEADVRKYQQLRKIQAEFKRKALDVWKKSQTKRIIALDRAERRYPSWKVALFMVLSPKLGFKMRAKKNALISRANQQAEEKMWEVDALYRFEVEEVIEQNKKYKASLPGFFNLFFNNNKGGN